VTAPLISCRSHRSTIQLNERPREVYKKMHTSRRTRPRQGGACMKDPEDGGSVAERSPLLGRPSRPSRLHVQYRTDGKTKTSERRRANGNRPNNPKPHKPGTGTQGSPARAPPDQRSDAHRTSAQGNYTKKVFCKGRTGSSLPPFSPAIAIPRERLYKITFFCIIARL
jgi:hypothetical protein